MKMEKIMESIKQLSASQGFYGRLYNTIITAQKNDIETYNNIKNELEKQQFKDTLDLIFYFEC